MRRAMKNLPVSKNVEDLPEAMSIKFNMLADELRLRGEDIITLSLGEAFFDLPLFPFQDLPLPSGFHYSDPRGIVELRERLSRYYLEAYGIASDHETELLISSGSKVLIYMALAAILNPGEEVIIFEPAWVSYPEQVRIAQGVPVGVPYHKGVDDLEKYHTAKTRAVIVNNPHNPSGKVYSRDELQKIFDFAQKHDLYVVSDEAYSEFVATEPFFSMASFDPGKERVIVMNSLSKNMGMSGWRVGYTLANRRLINLMFKLNQHLIGCPATLLEHYFAKYFDKILEVTRPQIKTLLERRDHTARFMDEIGLEYLPGSGTFYFCVSIGNSRLGSEEFARRLLEEDRVATVPGIGYGKSTDRFLRVSLGAESLERIKKGLSALREMSTKTS